MTRNSGFSLSEGQHPTRRLSIKNNKIVNEERLLWKENCSEGEVKQVLEIIFSKLNQILHKDQSKSSDALRMIYYSNLCQVMESLVKFMSMEFILELVYQLIRPMNNVELEYQSNNLDPKGNYKDYKELNRSSLQASMTGSSRVGMNDSGRMTMFGDQHGGGGGITKESQLLEIERKLEPQLTV